MKAMFRVKEYPQGWLAEVQRSKWTLFGLKTYWTHYIGYSGMEHEPFYFSSAESARDAIKRQVDSEVVFNFRYGK